MVNPLVGRATSDLLIGPDWAKNLEIVDVLNQDIGQARDVIKGVKRRLRSKNPKVQLLALTLLETLMANCGDIVHMHVAEKGIPNRMVKIVKKKLPDYHVKEKILTLIDTWQEAFGGPRARHLQFYTAYQDLLRAGFLPRRSDRTAPVFTPPQTHSLTHHRQNTRYHVQQKETARALEDCEYPTLSLSEIQNARGLMDILAEMLNALEPGNKEEASQEAIIDLVQQCRTYKQRVVHLTNSTSDESLLCLGLTLNDDLHRLLAKYEAIASESSIQVKKSKSKALIDFGDPVVTDELFENQPDQRLTSSKDPTKQLPIDLLLPTPNESNDSLTSSANVDLLSGENDISPKENDSLAIVPLGESHQPSSPASQQNIPSPHDMFFSHNNFALNAFDPHYTHPEGQAFHLAQLQHHQTPQVPHASIYPNEFASSLDASLYQQHHDSSAHSIHGTGFLPPPPWESQGGQQDNAQPGSPYSPREMQVNQTTITHLQPIQSARYSQQNEINQAGISMAKQPINQQPFHGDQLVGVQLAFQGNPQQMQALGMYYQSMQIGNQYPSSQQLEQGMYGLSLRDEGALNNRTDSLVSSSSSSSYVSPRRSSNPEDKLFGDLVNMAKMQPKNSSRG